MYRDIFIPPFNISQEAELQNKDRLHNTPSVRTGLSPPTARVDITLPLQESLAQKVKLQITSLPFCKLPSRFIHFSPESIK